MFLKLYQDQGKREQEKGTVFTLTCLSSLVASTDIGIGFLTEYLKAGVGYRWVNSVRSALLSIIKQVCIAPYGKSILVLKLIERILKIIPALSRFVSTCNGTKVFYFIKSKPLLTDCDLKTVFPRLVMLLCLTRGQRD